MGSPPARCRGGGSCCKGGASAPPAAEDSSAPGDLVAALGGVEHQPELRQRPPSHLAQLLRSRCRRRQAGGGRERRRLLQHSRPNRTAAHETPISSKKAGAQQAATTMLRGDDKNRPPAPPLRTSWWSNRNRQALLWEKTPVTSIRGPFTTSSRTHSQRATRWHARLERRGGGAAAARSGPGGVDEAGGGATNGCEKQRARKSGKQGGRLQWRGEGRRPAQRAHGAEASPWRKPPATTSRRVRRAKRGSAGRNRRCPSSPGRYRSAQGSIGGGGRRRAAGRGERVGA